MFNQQMDFQSGYLAAMEEVYDLLTNAEGRTEAHENTLAFVAKALGR